MTQVNWTDFGLAGLFAVFAVILLTAFLGFLKEERAHVFDSQNKIISTLDRINLTMSTMSDKMSASLTNVTDALIKHDSRVQATMEMMAKFSGMDDKVDPPRRR